tara:strand:- start:2167 stop:2625 length:459 start_codon:yes stop_codon:yes gene_type:complete
MSRIALVYVGEVNGVRAYAPMDAHDEAAIGDSNTLVLDMKGERCLRTELQNRSLHLYFTLLANAFNEAGLTVMVVLKALFKSPNFAWSAYLIKERIWRDVQEQTLGTTSTTKLETVDVGMIYESINRATSDKLGVSVPFPDKYNLVEQQLRK